MTVCFFGFFRAGEITAPSAGAFDLAVHLSWGDVAISTECPKVLRVFLKRLKTDQFGRGVAVFVSATGEDLCPVDAARAGLTLERGCRTPSSSRWVVDLARPF